MAQENISVQLNDLLASRDFRPELLDREGRPTDAENADIFTFDYVSSSGKDYGTMVIILDTENEMQVFYGDNLGRSMEGNDKNEFFDFVQHLHKFANMRRWTYSPKNINQVKYTMQGLAAIKEGLFEGYYGTRKVSYSGEPTQARLIIQHNRPLGETDARYRYVESLFIETVDSERFKLQFKNLAGARAMLEHVRQGGRPYDVRGSHITEMVSEIATLARFNRASAGRVLEGVTAELVTEAQVYYKNIRENLKRMGSSRGYKTYFESWHPAETTLQEELVDSIKTMFVEQTLDSRIEAALPVLARLQQENRMKEADIFESWAQRLIEGTWALPETPEQQQRLQDLMSRELIVGPDATNATEQLYDLVGDDILFDRLSELAERDPRANVFDDTEVMNRLAELGIQMPAEPAADQSQPVQESRVKELAMDLEDPLMSNEEFETKYGKSREEILQDQSDQQNMDEDAVDDFLARGGEIQQGKFRKPRKSERTDYGSRHIGGMRDAAAGKAGKTLGKAAATNFMGGGKAVVGEQGIAEGAMPAAVIRVKEKIRQMSDAEKKEYFKGKTQEQLQQMARRHGYGENSNVYAKYAAQGLNEFAPGGGGDDDIGDDPYKYPDPKPYGRSINFFGQFEADHFDKEDINDATGEFKGYWNYDGKPKLIAYFKFNDPARTGGDDPGMGWYYEPQNEGVAEALGDLRPKLGSKRDQGKSVRKWRQDRGLDESGMAEGQMSDIDIEYQDYKTVSPREFYNMYKITKQAWFAKYKNMLPQQGVAEGLAQDEAEEEYGGWRAEFVNEINYNTFEVRVENVRARESANFIIRPVDMVSYGPTLAIETMDVHDLQTGQTESWTNDDPAPQGPIAFAISALFYDDKQLQKKLNNIIDTHNTKGQDMMPGLNQRRSIGQEVDADAYIDSGEKTQAAMTKMKQGMAEGLNEFAMSDNDGNDGFSDDTLRQLAAQWYNGDEDPKVEQTLAAAGWEIGQDEGYDDTPGVFVVQAGDINGRSYISWPAHELEGLEEDLSRRGFLRGLGAAAVGLGAAGSAQARSSDASRKEDAEALALLARGMTPEQVAKKLGVPGPNHGQTHQMSGQWGSINRAAAQLQRQRAAEIKESQAGDALLARIKSLALLR